MQYFFDLFRPKGKKKYPIKKKKEQRKVPDDKVFAVLEEAIEKDLLLG
jgi:hypothetical protein